MAWRPDRLLPGFEALALAAPDDYDGRVVATLVREHVAWALARQAEARQNAPGTATSGSP